MSTYFAEASEQLPWVFSDPEREIATSTAFPSTTVLSSARPSSPKRSNKGVHQYLQSVEAESQAQDTSSDETDSTKEPSSDEAEKCDLSDCRAASPSPVPRQAKFSFGAMAKRMQSMEAQSSGAASTSSDESRPKFSFGAMAKRMQSKQAAEKDHLESFLSRSESSSGPSFSFGALASRLRDKAEGKSLQSLQSQIVQQRLLLEAPLKQDSSEDSQLKQLKAEHQRKTDGASMCQEERVVVQNSTDSGEKLAQPCPALILRSQLYTTRSPKGADDQGDWSPYIVVKKATSEDDGDCSEGAKSKFFRLRPSRAFKKRKKEKLKVFKEKECLGRKVGCHLSFKRRGFAK